MNGLFTEQLHWIVTTTAWTGALFLAAFFLDHMLKRRMEARFRLLLYVPVFVRLVLAPLWKSPLAFLFDWGPTASTTPQTLVPEAAITVAPISWLSPGPPVEPIVVEPNIHSAAAVQTQAAYDVGQVFLAIYALGIAVLVIRQALAWWRMQNIEHAGPGRPAPGKLASVRVVVHDSAGPLVFGIWRPTIVIPSFLEADDNDVVKRCAIAHEMSHISRGDLVLQAVLSILTIGAWPIVPLWLARWRMSCLMEEASDEMALQTLDISSKQYSRSLVRVRLAACNIGGVSMSGVGGIQERLLALTYRRWSMRWQGLSTTLAMAMLLACSGQVAPVEEPLEPAPLEPAPLGEVVNTDSVLSNRSEVTILLGRSEIFELPPGTVSMNVADPSIAIIVPLKGNTYQIQSTSLGETQLLINVEGEDGEVKLELIDILVSASEESPESAKRPVIQVELGKFAFLPYEDQDVELIATTDPSIVQIEYGTKGVLVFTGLKRGKTDVLIGYGGDDPPIAYNIIVE
ncbi:MAG: hypothetical protein HN348_16945 [Proteobacteria bacterium]|nr:hypothetical protein [Pseudomonadota bacterium]